MTHRYIGGGGNGPPPFSLEDQPLIVRISLFEGKNELESYRKTLHDRTFLLMSMHGLFVKKL